MTLYDPGIKNDFRTLQYVTLSSYHPVFQIFILDIFFDFYRTVSIHLTAKLSNFFNLELNKSNPTT